VTDTPTPCCTVCHHALYDSEVAHQACRPCTRRVDDNLAALPALYVQLGSRLAPGSSSGGPAVSGSRTAPLPLRLEPLNLLARGGVVTILQTWLIDFHDLNDWTYPQWRGDLRRQCEDVVKRLRGNLLWAAASHPAFAEFAGEIRQLRGQCQAQVDGERPPRRVFVTCPCSQTLGFTLDTTGLRCPNCQQQYGHSELLDLPLAERRAAA